MTELRPDRITAHESVLDEALVGRFSEGLEVRAERARTLYRGSFADGLSHRR